MLLASGKQPVRLPLRREGAHAKEAPVKAKQRSGRPLDLILLLLATVGCSAEAKVAGLQARNEAISAGSDRDRGSPPVAADAPLTPRVLALLAQLTLDEK